MRAALPYAIIWKFFENSNSALSGFATIAPMKQFLFLLLAVASATFAETKVFSGFTLIDGNGGAPVANAAMIVTDGKITWTGSKAGLKVPSGAEAIDLTGKIRHAGHHQPA